MICILQTLELFNPIRHPEEPSPAALGRQSSASRTLIHRDGSENTTTATVENLLEKDTLLYAQLCQDMSRLS